MNNSRKTPTVKSTGRSSGNNSSEYLIGRRRVRRDTNAQGVDRRRPSDRRCHGFAVEEQRRFSKPLGDGGKAGVSDLAVETRQRPAFCRRGTGRRGRCYFKYTFAVYYKWGSRQRPTDRMFQYASRTAASIRWSERRQLGDLPGRNFAWRNYSQDGAWDRYRSRRISGTFRH